MSLRRSRLMVLAPPSSVKGEETPKTIQYLRIPWQAKSPTAGTPLPSRALGILTRRCWMNQFYNLIPRRNIRA